jgi:hypothetical protein
MLRVFVTLMGGPEDTAATVFLALETQTAKSAAINAVAEKSLSDDNKALLRAIIRVTKSYQAERDRLVHWVWGDSPNLDALLLANPKVLVLDPSAHRENIFVYRAGELQAAITNNTRIAGFWFDFRWILTNHLANRDGELFAKLCAEPEIQEKLRRRDEQV